MPTPGTPAQYALILVDMAEARGCDRERLLEGTSLAESGIENIGARVGNSDFSRLVSNALRLTNDPGLGLRLGLQLNLSAHAVLGQAFLTCRDLAQVMDLFLKYYHLLAPELQLEFIEVGDRCVMTTVSDAPITPVEFGYELFYAAILNTLRGLLNRPDLQLRIEFPYPPPPHAALYYPVLGEDLHFDRALGLCSFPRALMEEHLPSSRTEQSSLYEAECARLLADLEGEDSIAERTLRLLRKLEGQYPNMPQIANMLNLSPRTYRRRLEEESQSFQALLDKVRAEHATRYLQHTRLPLSSIAYMVGVNDASNFRRAYTKWTGRSPREVRNAGAH